MQIPQYDPHAHAADCWFDPKAAQQPIDFIHECIRHAEGDLRGEPFLLQPWQQSVVGNLFGWKRKDRMGREVRRYRECLIYCPRKQGKSPLCAALALYVFFCDDEAGQQNYIAAADREQAGMLFCQCKGMVEQEPELSQRCRLYGGNASAGQSRSIVREADNSFLRVISADAQTKHGGNSHLILVDELHTQPNRELVDVLTTSTASVNRKQPLTVYITTADYNRPSICNEIYKRACEVRDNGGDKAKVGYNPQLLPVIYEALPEDDWTDIEVWRKANPNLNVSVSLDYLEAECRKAQETPAYENTFRRLHLNQRTNTDSKAIDMDRWDACATDVADPLQWRKEQIQRLRGAPCIAGLDLGSTSDLTALALLFEDYTVLPYFWVPREGARKREQRDRVPYLTWARHGWVTLTEGDVTDYDKVRLDINELAGIFSIKEVAVDRIFQGAQLCSQLLGDGFNVIAFGQGFLSMAAPTKRFLELVIEGKLQHGGNPVLRWMASNASTETDAPGNLKFSKKKSTEKIDGLIAVTMCLGRMMAQPLNKGSIYESRGLAFLGENEQNL